MAPSSSFGRSEFDAFLFASVGEDKSGVEVTVLSALIRLGFDPWQEAARLSELPREAAARTLASAFSLLPADDWPIPQMPALAARLVDCLPRPGTLPTAVVVGTRTGTHRARTATWRSTRWLFWLALAVGWYFLLSYLTDNPVHEPTTTISVPK
jgi:hypothetical protein